MVYVITESQKTILRMLSALLRILSIIKQLLCLLKNTVVMFFPRIGIHHDGYLSYFHYKTCDSDFAEVPFFFRF